MQESTVEWTGVVLAQCCTLQLAAAFASTNGMIEAVCKGNLALARLGRWHSPRVEIQRRRAASVLFSAPSLLRVHAMCGSRHSPTPRSPYFYVHPISTRSQTDRTVCVCHVHVGFRCSSCSIVYYKARFAFRSPRVTIPQGCRAYAGGASHRPRGSVARVLT